MEADDSDVDEPVGHASEVAVPEARLRQRARPADGTHRESLVSTLEGEIVPRLLMLVRSAGPAVAGAGAPGEATGPDDVEELARAVLAQYPAAAHEFVDTVRQRGVTDDHICVGLLIPAAQRLAERWERRELSYQQLTIGLNKLHAMALEAGGQVEAN